MEETPLDQYQPTFEPPKPMPLGKVVLINFAVMLVYMALTTTLMGESGQDAAMGVLILDAILLVAQVGINFVLGIVFLFTDLRHVGLAMIISALLVGVIGFGACFGKIALLDGM